MAGCLDCGLEFSLGLKLKISYHAGGNTIRGALPKTLPLPVRQALVADKEEILITDNGSVSLSHNLPRDEYYSRTNWMLWSLQSSTAQINRFQHLTIRFFRFCRWLHAVWPFSSTRYS